jgi:hypothetical protein
MSTFQAFDSFLISLGASITDVQTAMENALTTGGRTWQRKRKSLAPISAFGTIAPAANAFDMVDVNTLTVAAQTGYVGFQTAGFTPSVMYLTSDEVASTQPRSFNLDWSDTSNTGPWTTHQSWANEIGWGSTETRKYVISGAASHLYWRLNVINNAGSLSATNLRHWTVEDASGNRITPNIFTDFIPPAGEAIGNSQTRGIFRMEFGAAYIRFRTYLELMTAVPQVNAIVGVTGGAVAHSICAPAGAPFSVTATCLTNQLTVSAAGGYISPGSPIWGPNCVAVILSQTSGTPGGAGLYVLSTSPGTQSGNYTCVPVTTVTGAVGSAGSTATDNLRALYDALKNSADANFTAYTYEWQRPAAQNADDARNIIYMTQKTPGNNRPVTSLNGNCACTLMGASCVPMPNPIYSQQAAALVTVTTDLVNGFIYYLQINNRHIGLATKTNSAFYGPIHASYADNAKAVAALPVSGWGIPCSPIELFMGYDGGITDTGSYCYLTHYWGFSPGSNTSQGSGAFSSWTTGGAPFGRFNVRHKFYDITESTQTNWPIAQGLSGSNLFTGVTGIGNDFQVQKVSLAGEVTGITNYLADVANIPNGGVWITAPAMDIQDWYKFVGTANDEALLLVADTVATTTLAANMNTTDTTATVADTSTFQAAGFIVVDGEIIQYTSKDATHFLGCTRGKYATVAINHYTGDTTNQGLWFVKINGGALFCGYVKPT